MAKKSKKGRALRRRHGHFGMKDIHDATSGVRKLAADNPMVAAAAIGASVAALSTGMTPGGAALAGAAAGIAVQQATKK